MQKKTYIDNMEEKRDFDPAKEKHTLENNRAPGGLNDNNPNADRTPALDTPEYDDVDAPDQ
jgi:hypothetical protein